jgi:predicted Fe-Mo cluster-binding NifX family protein
MLARAGVGSVLTGHVGPKAWSALQAAGIFVYSVEGGTAEQAIAAFLSGNLAPRPSEKSGQRDPGSFLR